MKKITMVLSLIAIAASTLFVSCAKKHDPVQVPAFPSQKDATYAPNKNGVHTWTFSSAHTWSKANYWTGYRIDPTDATRVLYYIAPNKSWTATIVGEAQQYIQFRILKGDTGHFDEANYYYSSTVSGDRGSQPVTLVVTKIPEIGEEPFVGKLELTMAEQTMPLGTITIAPYAE